MLDPSATPDPRFHQFHRVLTLRRRLAAITTAVAIVIASAALPVLAIDVACSPADGARPAFLRYSSSR